MLICEGPTDTAALLDMGFANVVGRPSCTGGIKLLVELVCQRRSEEVVVVADGDEPGQGGPATWRRSCWPTSRRCAWSCPRLASRTRGTGGELVAGERGLPTSTLDKLADYLDLHITTGKSKRKKG